MGQATDKKHTWRPRYAMKPIKSKYAHIWKRIRIADKSATNRRRRKICFRFDKMIGVQSPTSRRPVANQSPTVRCLYTKMHCTTVERFGTRCIMINIFNMEVPHQMQSLRLQSGLQRLNTPSSPAWEKMQITKRGVFPLLNIFSDVVWRPEISIAEQLT